MTRRPTCRAPGPGALLVHRQHVDLCRQASAICHRYR
jgi:hypothetical protein